VAEPLPIAHTADGQVLTLLPGLGNRHGLITGATGTAAGSAARSMASSVARSMMRGTFGTLLGRSPR
jgi:hypothetical protein